MSMFKSKPELCDVVSLVIYSNTDVTLMLIADNNEHWIPSVKVPGGQSWDKAISKEIQEMIVDPGAKNKAKNTMGKYRGKIRWVTEAELTKLCSTDGLKSPELIEYFHLVKSGSSNVYYVQPEEFTIRENVSETNDSILVTGKSNIYQQLVEASGIDKLGTVFN
ncbi:hypothetical protein NQ314_004372 [Rhamnusium bicolor]|uniref:Uncharacterized protein n=1 Tax=Rhamnusium bicolor TaxID=1586634 RepID=A0AAV8ZK70_9CUCU|nr:hypothetical protein NQ314_004372 [Rhamnusium bicolor]